MATQKPKDGNLLFFHKGNVDRSLRTSTLNMNGCTIWFTGLSASGKSTVASALEWELVTNYKVPTYRLDGDNIRLGLNSNLGFSAADRTENIRRVSEVSKLFSDAGMITLSSFISPYTKDRDDARKIHTDAGIPFIEVHVHVPLSVAEERDPKGLYKKARDGVLKGFTGIDAPYEAPENPEILLETNLMTIDETVQKIISYLIQNKFISGGRK